MDRQLICRGPGLVDGRVLNAEICQLVRSDQDVRSRRHKQKLDAKLEARLEWQVWTGMSRAGSSVV